MDGAMVKNKFHSHSGSVESRMIVDFEPVAFHSMLFGRLPAIVDQHTMNGSCKSALTKVFFMKYSKRSIPRASCRLVFSVRLTPTEEPYTNFA